LNQIYRQNTKKNKSKKKLTELLNELSNINEQGNNYYNNKNYDSAEKKYKEGIERIEEFTKLGNIEEINGKINEHITNINEFKSKFYNKLSTALFKQKKYEESFKKAAYIIQNINKDNEVSYYIILYCLIELNKIILANYYADIIKKNLEMKNLLKGSKIN